MSIADELITRGWCQYALEDDDGRVCLLGAHNALMTGDPRLTAASTATNPFPNVPGYRALSAACGGNVMDFNNAPGRTFDEVLRVAKHADELLDAGS